jgi:hypothetical protein
LIGIGAAATDPCHTTVRTDPYTAVRLVTWVADKDAEKSKRVMQAMFQMDKIEIEGLKRAYAGE